MKAYVITIMDMAESRKVAERCVSSGEKFGVEVEVFPAVTPADDPLGRMERRGWPTREFRGHKYSKPAPCAATFLSHARLWEKAASEGPLLVLEHDAVFVAPIPADVEVEGLCSVGKPSYGKFRTPKRGLGPLQSKTYLPGAHAYVIGPSGARKLLSKAPDFAGPTDLYLCLNHFPWLTEFYPWPVVVDDAFSTIQKELGCRAKHNNVTPLDI